MAIDRPMFLRERQTELRASYRRPTQLRCWASWGLVERFVMMADLSAEGARIQTAKPPNIGETVTVRLLLPVGDDPQDIILRGRVVWRSEGYRDRGGLMGLAFERMGTAPEIAAYVAAGAD
jgi:hypothetical protein